MERIVVLEKALRDARSDLLEYGNHHRHCYQGFGACSCGWDDVLENIDKALTEDLNDGTGTY